MPYKDRDIARRYQRDYCARRRAEYLVGQCCVDCGATSPLELDHLDPADKVDHRIWSWSRTKIEAEIAKCVWRCQRCHQARHAAERRQDHGIGAYKRGCRCDVCRGANAAKSARYRLRRAGAAA